MSIYKILADHEHFEAFYLQMKDVMLTIGRAVPAKKLMHFPRHNMSLKDHWKPIEATFKSVDDSNKNLSPPQITRWVPGTLVLSESAVDALSEFLVDGELLPVATNHGPHWIFNCQTIVGADEENSERTQLEDGQVLDAEKLVFGNDAEAHPIFKSDYDGFRNLFCNEDFKKALESKGIPGLVLSKNLTGAF